VRLGPGVGYFPNATQPVTLSCAQCCPIPGDRRTPVSGTFPVCAGRRKNLSNRDFPSMAGGGAALPRTAVGVNSAFRFPRRHVNCKLYAAVRGSPHGRLLVLRYSAAQRFRPVRNRRAKNLRLTRDLDCAQEVDRLSNARPAKLNSTGLRRCSRGASMPAKPSPNVFAAGNLDAYIKDVISIRTRAPFW